MVLAASPRDRSAAILLAHGGLRPETVGNYRGTDGLRVADLPDLRVKGKMVVFEKLPAQVIVRADPSKSGRRYFTFLGPEGAGHLPGIQPADFRSRCEKNAYRLYTVRWPFLG